MTRAPHIAPVLTALLLAMSGCVLPPPMATAFDSRFDTSEASLRALCPDGCRRAPEPLRAVTYHAETGALRMLDAAGELTGERTITDVSASPRWAGRLAMVPRGERVDLLANDGTLTMRLSIPAGARVVGADTDSEVVVLVLRLSERRSRIEAHRLSGASLFSHEIDGDLGAPVLIDGHVLVPRDLHMINALRITNGHEVARLHRQDDVIAWVRRTPEGVFYGGHRAHALTSPSSDRSGPLVDGRTLDPIPPVEPWLQMPPHLSTPATASPVGATRLAWAPAPTTTASPAVPPQGATTYVVLHEHIFAWQGSELVWVQRLGASIRTAHAVDSGLHVLLANGEVTHLAATDGALRRIGTAHVVDSGALAGELPASSDPTAEPAPPVSSALIAVLTTDDSRRSPSRDYAARILGRHGPSSPTVIEGLLTAYTSPRTPPHLRATVRQALLARILHRDIRAGEGTDPSASEPPPAQDQTAIDRVLHAALEERANFLTGQRPPPLEIILPSLSHGVAGDEAVAPALLDHLHDPATPAQLLPSLVRALVRVDGEDAVPPLLDFVRFYRADSAFADDPTALLVAVRAIRLLGTPEQLNTLRAMAREETTHAAVRREASTERDTTLLPEPQLVVRPTPTPPPTRRRVTQRDIDAAMRERHADVTRCLRRALAEHPDVRLVRATFVVDATGRAAHILAVPESAGCLESLIASVRFPESQTARLQARFVVRVGPDPEALAAPRGGRTWWEDNRDRAPRDARVQPGLPWWSAPDADRAGSDASDDVQPAWWSPGGDGTDADASEIDRWWLPTDTRPTAPE